MQHSIEAKFRLIKDKGAVVSHVFAVVDCLKHRTNITVTSPEEIHAKAKAMVKDQDPHSARVDNKKARPEKQKIASGELLELNENGKTIAIFFLQNPVGPEFAQSVGLRLTPKKVTANLKKRKLEVA